MTDSFFPPLEVASCHTPVGWVKVRVSGGLVRGLEISQGEPLDIGVESGLGREVCTAVQRWLAGDGPWPRGFPLAPEGTPFQQRVWQELQRIPPKKRLTYGELAGRLKSGPRAVGGACRANPIPLLIPCHRVVAANGDGGFAGHTGGPWVEIKRWLLQHE